MKRRELLTNADLHPGMIPMVVANEVATAVSPNGSQRIEEALKSLPVSNTISRQVRRRNSDQAMKWMFIFGVLAGVAALAACTYLLLPTYLNSGDQYQMVSQKPSDLPLPQKPSEPDGGPTTKSAVPNVEQPKPRPPAPPLDKPLVPVPPDFGDPQNPKPNPPTDSGENTLPEKPDTPPKPIEPAELEKLMEALKLGRAALSDRNLDITTKQLAIAEPLARSGEPQKAFNRLKTMHEFVTQFMRLSNEAIDKYESGDEIRISESNAVVVVETSPQDLTIKIAGTTKTFLRKQLSTGLAIGIADQNFEESKYKSTLKAAFVITQKTVRDFEVSKAREFWKMGPESIELLEGYISDDYEKEELE